MLFRDLTEVAVQSWSCSSPQALLALCRGPRIGCSIKMVSQRDGQDLDPEMTNYFAKGEGGGGGGGGPRRGAPVGSAVAELKEGASAGVSCGSVAAWREAVQPACRGSAAVWTPQRGILSVVE